MPEQTFSAIPAARNLSSSKIFFLFIFYLIVDEKVKVTEMCVISKSEYKRT